MERARQPMRWKKPPDERVEFAGQSTHITISDTLAIIATRNSEAAMAQRPDERGSDPTMDAAALYREEIVTDRKVGTIRMMTPIKSDGSPDTSREVIYIGEAQLMTSVGTLPINFEIEGKTLGDAVKNFAEAAKEAVERTMRDLQELRRQQASSIVVPQGGMGGMGGPGGLPGAGGKIQIP